MKIQKYFNGFSMLGYAGTALSMFLSCNMCVSQSSGGSGLDWASMVLLGIVMTCMQCCFAISAYIFFRRGAKGLSFACAFLWVGAFITSVMASVGFFSTTESRHSFASMLNNPVYNRLLKDREMVSNQLMNPQQDNNIAEFDANIEAQREAGKRLRYSQRVNRALNSQNISKSAAAKERYMENAQKQQQEGEKYYRERLAELDRKIENFSLANPAAEASFYRVIAEILGISDDDAKSVCFLVLAFLLDLGSALLIVIGLRNQFDLGAFDSSGISVSQTEELSDDNLMLMKRLERLEHLENSLNNTRPAHIQPAPKRDYVPTPENDFVRDMPVTPNRLKDIREDVRPGYNPRMHPVPDDGSDDAQIAGILAARPDLLKQFIINGKLSDSDSQIQTPVPVPGSEPDIQTPVQVQRSDSSDSDSQIQTPVPVSESDSPDFNSSLKTYTESAYKLNRDGSLTGRLKIASLTGLPHDICRQCHTWLKSSGHIYVQGNKSFPVSSKQEILKILGNGHKPGFV